MDLVSRYHLRTSRRPPLRVAKDVVRRALMRARYRYYVQGSGARAVGLLPSRVRRLAGLDDAAARTSRRIELGAGPYPQPGYLHVDLDTRAPHLEAVAEAWSLPFPTGWAQEILAIHILEHIHPRQLERTLSEWNRVLAPGGRVRVHVPNSPELMRCYLEASDSAAKWTFMGALMGMYCGPTTSGPQELSIPADHQIFFDRPLLEEVLATAGFTELTDLTEVVVDRHTEGWRPAVEHYSIVFEAAKPALR